MNPPSILTETAEFMVINKPAGWIVNSAQTTKGQPVVEEWLAANFEFEIYANFLSRHGIVHRLDKETSGCLIIAKTQPAFENLQSQFKERKVHKKYTALVHGLLKEPSGEITAAVGRLPWRRDRFGVLSGGREAKTVFKLIDTFNKNKAEYSLLELEPETGRTHQIRIHLKYLGHPIVSDTFYAGRKTARKDRLWCPRLFLHASEISFLDPISNKLVKVASPLAQDLQEVLDQLR